MTQLQSLTCKKKHRSALEDKVANQLDKLGVEYSYEATKLDYKIPSRKARYTPDFIVAGTGDEHGPRALVLEAKGWFRTAAERQKMVLVKQCNPHLDIRIIFQNANKPIYKGSPTTYAKWADENGFIWSDKGIVPIDWIKEINNDGT
jgi:hypothetical protein